MIRIRGLPISNKEAAELTRLLRVQAGASIDVAERLERALLAGTGMIATDRPQATAVLAVLEADRFQEVRESLRQFVDASGAAASE